MAGSFTWPASAEAQVLAQSADGSDQADTRTAGSAQLSPPPTGREKFHHYLRALYSPLNILGTASGAAIGQARDDVPEWRQGMSGYGRRLASSYGKHVVKESLRFGIGGLLGYDPRYFPSPHTRKWPRTLDAIAQAARTRDDQGRWRVAYPHLVSVFGAGLISRAWYPKPHQTAANGLKSGAITFGLDAAANILREFFSRHR